MDFAVKVLGLPFRQAVEDLLRQPAAQVGSQCGTTEFSPPPKNRDASGVVEYLTRVRRLPAHLVADLVGLGLVYQDGRGNAVFPCTDKSGKVRAAYLRGTDPRRPFKGMAPGSDSRFGWCWAPSAKPAPVVAVTESPIDAASLATLKPRLKAGHVLSLNGLRREALMTFLSEHEDVKTVVLALDADDAGEAATERFREELSARRYVVGVLRPPAKDWNEALAGTESGQRAPERAFSLQPRKAREAGQSNRY